MFILMAGFWSNITFADQTGDCTAGTEFCEDNNQTTTSTGTNTNTNTNTNTSTNTNTNTNTSTGTNTNTNTNVISHYCADVECSVR